jgi:hypothetical protein
MGVLMASEITNAARATAARLGISPSDLLTAISYETGGTMSPSMWGGKGGNYLGLIQFGPSEQAKYGVNEKQTPTDQMGAVENYLRDRGVKPGMGLLDVYSTINAGRPGLYDRSDANNGGAPGTVYDKVATQMVGHRARANTMLGDESNPIPISPPDQSGSSPSNGGATPTSPEPAAASGTPGGETTPAMPDAPPVGVALSKMISGQQAPKPVQIDTPQPPGLPSAQRLAAIMQRLQVQNGSN